MELRDAVRRRRMVRSFAERPLPRGLVEDLLTDTLRAPTAGHARGTAWVLLEGTETRRYWDAVTTPGWRAASPRWPGLSRAAAVAVSLCSPERYLDRYSQPDKAGSGLGRTGGGGGDEDRDDGGGASATQGALGSASLAWPVPYWYGDAAFAVMTLLLGATDAGLGACFLGSFRGERALLDALGVPPGWRMFGAVALGHPDGSDHRSPSLDLPGPAAADRVHHGHWGGRDLHPPSPPARSLEGTGRSM